MAECDPRPFNTTLKPFDISGFSKEKIEEAVLGEILRQIAADREDKRNTCIGDCPHENERCTLMIPAETYSEIVNQLAIWA
jgi:hypothetical protein